MANDRIGVRLDDELRNMVFESAERLGLSVSEYIRKVLRVEQSKRSVEQVSVIVEQDIEPVEQFVEQKANIVEQKTGSVEQFVEQGVKSVEQKSEVLSDIEFMCSMWEISLDDFLKMVQSAMLETELNPATGKLMMVTPELWDALHNEESKGILNNLERLCDDKGVDMVKVYVNVLTVGGKITYKDVQEAKNG